MTDRELKLLLLRGSVHEMGVDAYFVCHAIHDAGFRYVREVLGRDIGVQEFASLVYDMELSWDQEIMQVVRCIREMRMGIAEIMGPHLTLESWTSNNGGPGTPVPKLMIQTRIAWINHMIEVAEQEGVQ